MTDLQAPLALSKLARPDITCASTAANPRAKILARAASNIAEIDRRVFDLVDGIGDTPIERLLYEALYVETKTNWRNELSLIIQPPGERGNHSALDSIDPFRVLLESQIDVEGARVDFLLTAMNGKIGRYKSLIVECDGHEFHERTKDQAARDRARDRAFQRAGRHVFRFTGSEIWADPCSCANQIVRWVFDTIFPAEGSG